MLAYYISSHGYGHGARSTDVINALKRCEPDLPLVVISRLPRSFLENRIDSLDGITIREAGFDVGMVQLDSIRVDVAATYDAVSKLYGDREALIQGEGEFIRDQGIRTVVADIPAIPLEAAHSNKIPCLALGNFAWDWIYSPFIQEDERWQALVDQFREAYGRVDLLLRMPFAEPMSAFPRIEDIPLAAKAGATRRDELSRMTGAQLGKKWVLLSFTSLDWSPAAIAEIESLKEYEFFTVKPLHWNAQNIHAVDRELVPFADVMASCDVVVSKPGFGVLSECIVNGKPFIYAERENFVEYPILVESTKRFLKNQHIPAKDLYAGRLVTALDSIWTQPDPPETLKAGGDVIAAERILEQYHSAS